MSPKNRKPAAKDVESAKAKAKVSPFDSPLALKKNPVSIITSPAKKPGMSKLDQRGIVVDTLSDAYVMWFLHHTKDNCGAYLGNLHKLVVEDPKFCPSIVGACERINQDGSPMTIHSHRRIHSMHLCIVYQILLPS